MSDRARAATIGVVVVAVLAFALWFFRARTTREGERRASVAGAATSAVERVSPGAPAASTQGGEEGGLSPRRRFTAEDRRRRDRVRAMIYRAFHQPPPPTTAPTGTRRGPIQPLGPGAPALDKDYIRDRIQNDFKPLAKECYEAALEADASLGGKLVFSFTIVGDDSVGGIVESVDFAEGSDIEDEELLYCMRESLLSMTFAPPQKGGTVTVTYPMLLSPSGPPDGG